MKNKPLEPPKLSMQEAAQKFVNSFNTIYGANNEIGESVKSFFRKVAANRTDDLTANEVMELGASDNFHVQQFRLVYFADLLPLNQKLNSLFENKI